MSKNNVICCDFRRTERRARIDEILNEICAIAHENPNMKEQELFMLPKVIKLQNEYADLVLEEEEWGGVKYFK